MYPCTAAVANRQTGEEEESCRKGEEEDGYKGRGTGESTRGQVGKESDLHWDPFGRMPAGLCCVN